MCEAEQWDEALIELKRQSYAPSVRRDEPLWRTKIYLGMERYEDVLNLKDEAKRAGCDIGPFLAVAYARLGHTERALRLAREAHRVKRPGSEMALGHVYVARGEYDDALRRFEAAAQNRWKRASALREIARTLVVMGDFAEARAAYEQAIRLTPFALPEDLRSLAECYRQTGRERVAMDMDILADEKS